MSCSSHRRTLVSALLKIDGQGTHVLDPQILEGPIEWPSYYPQQGKGLFLSFPGVHYCQFSVMALVCCHATFVSLAFHV